MLPLRCHRPYHDLGLVPLCPERVQCLVDEAYARLVLLDLVSNVVDLLPLRLLKLLDQFKLLLHFLEPR